MSLQSPCALKTAVLTNAYYFINLSEIPLAHVFVDLHNPYLHPLTVGDYLTMLTKPISHTQFTDVYQKGTRLITVHLEGYSYVARNIHANHMGLGPTVEANVQRAVKRFPTNELHSSLGDEANLSQILE